MAWQKIKCVRSSIVEKGEKKWCTISREKETLIIFMHAAKLYFLSHWDTRKLKINLGLEAFWCVSQTIFFCVRMRALCIVVLSLSDVLFSYSLWTPSFDSVFFPYCLWEIILFYYHWEKIIHAIDSCSDLQTFVIMKLEYGFRGLETLKSNSILSNLLHATPWGWVLLPKNYLYGS